MTPLSISMTPPDGKADRRASLGIRQLFHAHLSEMGFGGKWMLRMHKKTGRNDPRKLFLVKTFLDVASGGKERLLYAARPESRDSSWDVLATPPTGTDVRDVAKAEGETEQAKGKDDAPSDEAPESDLKSLEGTVVKAEVASHEPHGLGLLIAGSHRGFVPLEDLSDEYDKTEMNSHPVGSKLKVMVTGVKEGLASCTSRLTDGVLTTSSPHDYFTGKPSLDGTLCLKGFTQDINRTYGLVEWLAVELFNKGGEGGKTPISLKDMASLSEEYIKGTYPGTTEVNYRAIYGILNALCGKTDQIVEPLLRKSDEGICLSDFGWGEVRATVMMSKRPSSPLPANAGRESVEPDQQVQPEIASELEEIAEYAGKLSRLAEIRSQSSSLRSEEASILEWLGQQGKEKKDRAGLLIRELNGYKKEPRLS